MLFFGFFTKNIKLYILVTSHHRFLLHFQEVHKNPYLSTTKTIIVTLLGQKSVSREIRARPRLSANIKRGARVLQTRSRNERSGVRARLISLRYVH